MSDQPTSRPSGSPAPSEVSHSPAAEATGITVDTSAATSYLPVYPSRAEGTTPNDPFGYGADHQASRQTIAQIGGSARGYQGNFVPLAALSTSRLRPNGRSASRIFIHRRA